MPHRNVGHFLLLENSYKSKTPTFKSWDFFIQTLQKIFSIKMEKQNE